MKKTAKLKLSRETLRQLDASDLEQAQGQATTVPTVCISVTPTRGSCYISCTPTCQPAVCLTTTTDFC